MKKLIIALAAVAITATSSYGQGALVFVNRVAGLFDVPIYIQDTTTGAGTLGAVQARLYAGDTLLGSTTFRGTEGQLAQYLLPVDVIVQGNNGTPIDLRVRFFLGDTDITAQSSVFTATPGVPPNPPGNLTSLTGPLTVVPEPSVIALAVLGAGALLFRRRK